MKLTKVILGLATLALGVASAASSYSVTLFYPMWIGSTEPKPGDYKVEMKGDKAVFKSGKKVVEFPATLDTSERKYDKTVVMSSDKKIQEIGLGGTESKIVFSTDASAAKGASAGQ